MSSTLHSRFKGQKVFCSNGSISVKQKPTVEMTSSSFQETIQVVLKALSPNILYSIETVC